MPQAGRLGDKSQCPSCSHSCPGCPHSVIGPSKVGSANVRINGKPALRVGDTGVHSSCCGANTWEAVQGAPGVRINGKFAHRMGDAVHHCGGTGRLAEGSPNVNIGGTVAPGAPGAGSPGAPTHVVWYQVLDEYMRPVRDLLTHVMPASGGAEVTRRTDANGQVRVPVSQPGPYHVSLGPEHPALPPPPPPPVASATPRGTPPATAPSSTPPATTPISTRHRVATTTAQSLADAAPTRHDLAWSIKIVTPAPDQKLYIEPGNFDPLHDATALPTAPLMPVLDLCANVFFKHDGNTEELKDGTVIWEFRIKGKYRVRDHSAAAGYRLQPYDLPGGKFASAPGETVAVRLAPATLVGGSLEVKAQFEASSTSAHAGVKIEDVFQCGDIKGHNPARTDLHNFIIAQAARMQTVYLAKLGDYGDLAWLFFRMFQHESAQHQFNAGPTPKQIKAHKIPSTAEEPNYGDPSGVGIGQRDPDTSEWNFKAGGPQANLQYEDTMWPAIFWNWKASVIAGMEVLYDKIRGAHASLTGMAAKQFPKDPPQPTKNEVIRQAIRMYNGGLEFVINEHRKFVISPHMSSKHPEVAYPNNANRHYPDWVLHQDVDTPDCVPAGGQYPIPADMPIETSDMATIKGG